MLMAMIDYKTRAAARRPIETARRETKRAVALAKVEGRDGLAADLERVAKLLGAAKRQT